MKVEKTVIALGFFDGVHRGHGALLRKAAERAGELGAVPAVFTFDRSPREFVTGTPVPLLNSNDDRRDIIRRVYGIERVIFARFDQAMMTMGWEDYIQMLVRDYGAVHFVAGHDHRFGHRNEGTVALLQAKYPEVRALRDASVEQVEALKEALGDVVYRRALHVVSECQRCLACKEALERRDYEKVGLLLYQSHASLRDNFEVSTPEIDILVEIASEQDGVFGARITGGGFGGCVVCFVQSDKAEAVMRAMETEYKARTGIECSAFITSPEQGARVMTGDEVDACPSCASCATCVACATCDCCKGCKCCECVKKVVKSPYFWMGAAAVAAAGVFAFMHRRN